MSNRNDSFGDRMKRYENVFRYYLPRRIPAIIRLDGKAFHTFTKGMKKLILCCLMLIVFALPSRASAGYEYSIRDNYITIDRSEVNEIPASINGVRVKNIGRRAFSNTDFEAIYLPDTVNTIYAEAFAYCSKLSSIHIPKSTLYIGQYCFYSCDKLKEIYLPRGIIEIGEYAFGHTLGSDGDCISPHTKIENFTIYGYTQSVAETYANKNGFRFISIDTVFDLNQDSNVDISDAMMLFYKVAQKADCDGGDINGDGIVDIFDAMRLFYYIAGKL